MSTAGTGTATGGSTTSVATDRRKLDSCLASEFAAEGPPKFRSGINPGAASAALPIDGALDAGSEPLNAKGTRFHDRAIDPTIGQARDDR